MDFDCFKWDFVIFDIGNEYQDVYADLYKLKSDLRGDYVKKWLKVCGYWAVNRPEIGVTSGENWY